MRARCPLATCLRHGAFQEPATEPGQLFYELLAELETGIFVRARARRRHDTIELVEKSAHRGRVAPSANEVPLEVYLVEHSESSGHGRSPGRRA
jgi:hypothetical protein